MPYDNSPAAAHNQSMESALQERFSFYKIDNEAKSALAEFYPAFEKALPDLLTQFYDHVAQWPVLVQMFGVRPGGQQAALDRARSAQSTHWLKLFSGRFDQSYVESARRIGEMHARIGLDPKWYFGGYSLTIGNLLAVAIGQYSSRFNPGGAHKKSAHLVASLVKCAMLDMDLVMQVYLEVFYKAQFQKKLDEIATGFESSIGGIISRVSESAGTMQSTASGMSATAEETSKQAGAVAAASEQASTNVQTVASAAEERSKERRVGKECRSRLRSCPPLSPRSAARSASRARSPARRSRTPARPTRWCRAWSAPRRRSAKWWRSSPTSPSRPTCSP